jgi:hypothetical protein
MGNYRRNVDDADVVAAIVAGELDGLAAALDTYAAPLFEYCVPMAADVAADAVRETFIVAWSKLDGLRDPDRLYPWLQAVAGNECFRRKLVGDVTEAPAGPVDEAMPPGLPGQVLSACADNTPAGRAYRISAAHRAGPFGRDGFPKTDLRPGTWRPGVRWRRGVGMPFGVERYRRTTAAIGAMAVVAVAVTAIIAIVPAGAPQHNRASAGQPGSGLGAGHATSDAGLPTTPARLISPSASAPGSSTPTSGTHPTAPPAGMPGATQAGAPQASPPAVPMSTVTPITAPATTGAQGLLAVNQTSLNFVSIRGGASTRTFVITAENGPVTGYSITVPAGLPGSLTVTPSSGSLAAGESATITATASTTAPFDTSLTLYPGGIVITVVVKANPQGD